MKPLLNVFSYQRFLVGENLRITKIIPTQTSLSKYCTVQWYDWIFSQLFLIFAKETSNLFHQTRNNYIPRVDTSILNFFRVQMATRYHFKDNQRKVSQSGINFSELTGNKECYYSRGIGYLEHVIC